MIKVFGVLVLNLILNRVFYTDTGVALATSLALTIGAIAMTIQLFHGTKIVRLVPLLKGLAATAAMAVVLYGGGRNARIAGYRVGGKSGTSQKLDSADEKARIASFVAVAPIDDPQFLCLVCLDEPHSWTTAGGSLSAPVCAEVLEQTLVYKGVPRAAVPDTPASDAETSADLPEDGDSFDGA